MKKITLSAILLLGAFGYSTSSYGQTANVQIIHNSADEGAAVVDVYAGTTLLIPDFAFRTATAFLELPAGTPIDVGIAPGTSTSSTDAIATITVNFTAGETYVVVANGLVTPGAGYAPSSTTRPFDLYAFGSGREEALNAGDTDVLVFHGATDAPAVNIDAVGAGTLIGGIAWSEFHTGYLELANADYTINVTTTGGTVVRSYQAPLETLGLADSAIVVLASGFLDPTVNSDGEAFGLWVALPEGGDLIELPESNARLQVIHNSADLAAEMVDIYYDGALLLNDFTFRTASPYIDVTAEVDHVIGVAPSTSTSADDTLVAIPLVFSSNETYVAIANGQVSPSGYAPAVAFSLDVFTMGQETAATTGNTDVLVFHGSTDAPTVDIDEATAGNLVDNAAYGDFAGYLELATADYIIQVKDETGASVLFSYSAPLATLGLTNSAIVVVASGFLDPSANSDGESFGLWVALPGGGDMVELPVAFVSITEQVNNFAVFPNPATDVLNITGIQDKADIQIFNISGEIVLENTINPNAVINTSNLSSGLYYMTITENEAQQQVKFVIK